MNLLEFPHELFDRILRRLDVETLLVLRRTNKYLRVFCSEETVWMQMAIQSASPVAEFKWRGSWFRTAIESHVKSHSLSEFGDRNEVEEVGQDWNLSGITSTMFVSDFLYRRWYRAHITLLEFVPLNEASTLSRVSGKELSKYVFEEKYDKARQPVVLTEMSEFTKLLKWDLSKLIKCFGNVLFKIDTPFRQGCKMTLDEFMKYAIQQTDEEPLYLFDSEFASKVPTFFKDYTIPTIFPDDLMDLLGESPDRPKYRWLVIGPMRSGTSWHIDPWCSTAWNLLISGRKRWALYPPGKIPPGVKFIINPHETDQEPYYETCTSLQWFLDVLPNLIEVDEPCYDFIQYPGETVFIPYGWWHCVLNLDITLSVTQNFISQTNLAPSVQLLSQGAKGYYPKHYPVQGSIKECSRVPRVGSHWLGSWLRVLWKHRIDLRERLWTLGASYVYSNSLLDCLRAICKLNGLPSPYKEDSFPYSATSNILLKTGNVLIKLYFHKSPLDVAMQQSAESEALQWIQKLPENERIRFPQFVAQGLVNFEDNELCLEVPYLISSCCEGVPISTKFSSMDTQQKREIADQLGCLVASFHSLTPSTTSSKKCPLNEVISFERMEDLLSWIQGNVCSKYHTFFQAQDPDLNWSSKLGQTISMKKENFVGQNPHSPCKLVLSLKQHSGDGPWSPFLAFLNWRRSVCVGSLQSDDIPNQLIDQLEDYLPTNAADLTPIIKRTHKVHEQQKSSPVFLHGDLTADNILLISHCQNFGTGDIAETKDFVSIVDFGDFGSGDPLYDFVSLCLSTLRSDSALLEKFVRSYWKTCKQKMKYQEMSELWGERKHNLSYCAMCYCLLHEDGVLRWLFANRPELKNYKTWNEIQTSVWGIMDTCITEILP
eukprot:g1591.t1